MGFIKELFDKAENGVLTYDQFEQACKDSGIKLANLANGEYVSKQKYDSDILSRDTDLQTVREQLNKANGDSEKLATLKKSLEELQGKYTQQAYEFSVREYASGKKFTSNAAKRDFVKTMIEKKLTMENGKIIGADDFTTAYSAENADAFATEKAEEPKKPQFVGNTTPPAEQTEMTKEQFRRLNYIERNNLFNENPELYNKLKN